jgi:hypothetical protein
MAPFVPYDPGKGGLKALGVQAVKLFVFAIEEDHAELPHPDAERSIHRASRRPESLGRPAD